MKFHSRAFGLLLVTLTYSLIGMNLDQQLLDATRKNDINRVASLLQDPTININIQDHLGYTPLHWAAHLGATWLIQLLLTHGADVHRTSNGGNTALHKSITNCTTDKHYTTSHRNEIIKLLLEAGIDINTKNHAGFTALDKALEINAEKLINTLLLRGATINTLDKEKFVGIIQHYLDILEKTVTSGDSQIIKKLLHSRSLHYVITEYSRWDYQVAQLVKLLVSYGADIHALDNDNRTPAQCAYSKNFIETQACISAYEHMLDNLQPNQESLTQAITHGYYHLVKLYIKRGAQPDLHHLALANLRYTQTQHTQKEYTPLFILIGRLLLEYLRLTNNLHNIVKEKSNIQTNTLYTDQSKAISTHGLIGIYGIDNSIAHTIARQLV